MTQDGAGQAGSDAGAHMSGSRGLARRTGRHPGRRAASCRASSPRAKRTSTQEKVRYTSIRRTGPESLRHFKRTYMEALRRQISTGHATTLTDPRVVPIREDKRYRSWNERARSRRPTPSIIYMMDVSGSMTDEQKEIVRTEAFWIDTWLRSQYEGLERRYIIHDAAAKEVDEQTFYHTRESGGTRISSAYKVAAETDRKHVSRQPSGTSTASSFPTATTGAKTTATACDIARARSCLPV